MFNNIALNMASFLLVLMISLCAPLFAESLKDPMRPSGHLQMGSSHENPAEVVWNLTSTLVSDGRRIAMINGRLLAVGDHIDGAQVVEIFNNRVRLKYRDKFLSIVLDNNSLRKPVKDLADNKS